MVHQKEIPKQQTAREIESGFSNPSREKQEIESVNNAGREMQGLFLKGAATVEIKKDDLGQKYAIVKHQNKTIYSTKVPDQVANFEEFLKDPEAYLRKQQLKETEEDLLREVEEEIVKPRPDKNHN